MWVPSSELRGPSERGERERQQNAKMPVYVRARMYVRSFLLIFPRIRDKRSKITKFFVLPSLVRCSTSHLLLPCLPERREAHSTPIHSTPTSTRGRKASHHNYISIVAAALFILWYKLNCGSIHDSHPERGEDEMIRFVSSSLKFQDSYVTNATSQTCCSPSDLRRGCGQQVSTGTD